VVRITDPAFPECLITNNNEYILNVATVQFNAKENPFFDSLRKRVDDYFDKNNLSYKGNWKIVVKTVFFFAAAAGTYSWLVFFTPAVWLSVLLCVLLGVLFAGIGFNVMHDGAHGSYSNIKWINEVMGYSLNLLGGDVQLWKIKHNLIHHSFTNVEGLDDDINIQPFLRTNENQKLHSFHKFQHWYFFLLYGLTYLSWIFLDDFSKYFTRKIGPTTFRKFKWHQHVIFWVTKLSFLFVFIVLPAMMVGFWTALLGFAIVSLSCGLLIAIVFQLAHVVEDTQFSNAFN
jgi:linoleoyl-CoA desaturase